MSHSREAFPFPLAWDSVPMSPAGTSMPWRALGTMASAGYHGTPWHNRDAAMGCARGGGCCWGIHREEACPWGAELWQDVAGSRVCGKGMDVLPCGWLLALLQHGGIPRCQSLPGAAGAKPVFHQGTMTPSFQFIPISFLWLPGKLLGRAQRGVCLARAGSAPVLVRPLAAEAHGSALHNGMCGDELMLAGTRLFPRVVPSTVTNPWGCRIPSPSHPMCSLGGSILMLMLNIEHWGRHRIPKAWLLPLSLWVETGERDIRVVERHFPRRQAALRDGGTSFWGLQTLGLLEGRLLCMCD